MSGPSIRERHLAYVPFVYPSLEKITLPRVTSSKRQNDFLDVLRERRSVKQLGGCAIEKLSEILFHAVRHPIDILVGLPEKDGRRLFIYEPLSHSLRRLDVPIDLQRDFFDDINQTLSLGDSVLLWFSIQYMRTASKYNDYESLVWRDAGAQLCCLQQVAKYVGLDSCPIGYLAEETFDKMFNSASLISGGGMIIGMKL